MRATVLKVSRGHIGDAFHLTLRIPCASGERVHTYRVSAQSYAMVGSPAEGDELEGEPLYALIAEEEEKRAYERALRILASGDNTRAALERKLRERGFDGRAAHAAVLRVEKEGYLREEDMLLRQFAVFQKRLWGPGKYMPALLAKGFSRELVERARERAADEGIYDAESVKAQLLERFSPCGYAETRALLYKYGFR